MPLVPLVSWWLNPFPTSGHGVEGNHEGAKSTKDRENLGLGALVVKTATDGRRGAGREEAKDTQGDLDMEPKMPKGFRCAGVSAGIKASGAPDMALIVSDRPAAVAGTFAKVLRGLAA